MTPTRVAIAQVLALCAAVVLPGACGDDDDARPDAGVDAGLDATPDARAIDAPPVAFDRFCRGAPWEADLLPAQMNTLDGTYLGAYRDLPSGARLTMKIVPDHPFQVQRIRLAFAGDPGTVRVLLTEAFGRSYPDLDAILIPTTTVQVDDPDPDTWLELDVTEHRLFLEPTQHYILLVETQAGGPTVALESLGSAEWSRAQMHLPGESVPYGSDGNFRMQLAGQTFCRWEAADRLFGADLTPPFTDVRSSRVAITDLDSDGHDDVVVNTGGPQAFLGDGQGGFRSPAADPFPDVPKASMLVFADVDNDGHVDAFAAHNVGADADGDGVTRQAGDCNDASALVSPDATEVAGNGVDDDCDGTADDGLDSGDADQDGVSIAAGDCDDTRDDVHPGAPELLDGRDNDCNGAVDEVFGNRILLNDGSGHFAAVGSAGVETLDQATAAGFADADGDGALDLYWGNWLVHYPDDPALGDRYVTGNGDGTFDEATTAAGLELATPYSCYGVIWTDYDNDGHPDLFVGNYHLYPNQLWRNQGNGTFVDVAETVGVAFDDVPSPIPLLTGGHTYGGDFGDIDNDGDLDFFMPNLAHPRTMPWSDPSMFVINGGAPDFVFENQREELGIVYDEGDVNATFADFDNDMDLDLAVGTLYTGHYSKLYRNDGALGFTDITYESGTAVHDSVSVVWSDVDEDGDLDLIIADRHAGGGVTLFLNRTGNENQWVQLVLQGTTTNRGAIGARVTLSAGGVTQMRDIRGGGGHSNTQSSRVVHFGLAQQTVIDEITVRWSGGATETITGVSRGARYRVVVGTGTGSAL